MRFVLIQIGIAGFDGATREASLCAIYVWMRFSATRALTWQRNYNTQPRQLSGAQDALSGALADAHGQATTAAERHYIRGILSCTGAGGDGQVSLAFELLDCAHAHEGNP
jgi:alpha-glucan, water dikinase